MAVEVIRSKTRKAGALRKRWEFGLEFYRDDRPEQHDFLAYPAMDAGGLNYTLSSARRPERAIEGMVRSIRKQLADDDGTPAAWRPTRYEPPAEGEDAEAPEDFEHDEEHDDHAHEVAAVEEADPEDLDDAELMFTGPTGEPITGEQASEALKFENGSSRRRFSYLMDEDESLTLEVDQLQTVYKKLLAQVTDRPTRR